MKCFGWPKQWKSYDGDESISDTEKARLLLQCITGKAKEASSSSNTFNFMHCRNSQILFAWKYRF
jgi:hypothetical protein